MTRRILLAVGIALLIIAQILPYPLLYRQLRVDATDSYTAGPLTVTVGTPVAGPSTTKLVPVDVTYEDRHNTYLVDPKSALTADGTLVGFFPASTVEASYRVVDPVSGEITTADFTGSQVTDGLRTLTFTVNDGPSRQFVVEPKTGTVIDNPAQWEKALAGYHRVRISDWLTFLLRTAGGALIILAVLLWLRARL